MKKAALFLIVIALTGMVFMSGCVDNNPVKTQEDVTATVDDVSVNVDKLTNTLDDIDETLSGI